MNIITPVSDPRRTYHLSSCAACNGPAYEPGPCDCGAEPTPVSQTPSAPPARQPAGKSPSVSLPAGTLMSRLDLQGSLRPINVERDRLRKKITELMARRDALPECILRDNLTRQIDADDTELQMWTDIVTDREARIAELDALEAHQSIAAE